MPPKFYEYICVSSLSNMVFAHKIFRIVSASAKSKKLCLTAVTFVFMLLAPRGGIAQGLTIQSATLPDTIYYGTSFTFNVTVWNDNDSSDQGNLQFWFLNPNLDSLKVPLGGFQNTLQFFAPQQVRTFQVQIPVIPDFFLEGGNTVVIWPSMVGETLDPQSPFLSEVYVLNPNGSLQLEIISPGKFRIDNPTGNELIIRSAPNSPMPKQLEVLDLSGRLLKRSDSNAPDMGDISGLLPGIYLVVLRFDDGQVFSQKIIKTNR
jgi:hypothetical protein